MSSETPLCPWILVSGKRKGLPCDKKAYHDGYCSAHAPTEKERRSKELAEKKANPPPPPSPDRSQSVGSLLRFVPLKKNQPPQCTSFMIAVGAKTGDTFDERWKLEVAVTKWYELLEKEINAINERIHDEGDKLIPYCRGVATGTDTKKSYCATILLDINNVTDRKITIDKNGTEIFFAQTMLVDKISIIITKGFGGHKTKRETSDPKKSIWVAQ